MAFGPIVWGETLGYLLTVILGSSISSRAVLRGTITCTCVATKEKGNLNTPLELAMLNEPAHFHLVIDVIDRVPKLRTKFDF